MSLLRHRVASLTMALSVLFGVTALVPLPAGATAPKPTYQVTSRVSVATSGAQSASGYAPRITPDGRYVVFGMVNPSAYKAAGPFQQIFRRDQLTGAVELVSVAVGSGQVPNGPSNGPSVSDDGRWIAFDSTATNLIQTDTNNHRDVFLRDMQSGITRLISVGKNGDNANGDSQDASIDGIGDKVAFDSAAENLVSGDGNNVTDVFVRNWLSDVTTRASVSTASVGGNALSLLPQISGDGGWVTFVSSATNLVVGDLNGYNDVFLRSLGGLQTTLVSRTTLHAGDGHSFAPSINGDGTQIAFASQATKLVANDTNKNDDTFVWTRSTGGIQRVSLNAFGGQIASGSYLGTGISRDGNVVAWTSKDKDVTGSPGNGTAPNVYRRDLSTSRTALITADPAGAAGNAFSITLSVDQTGRRFAYDSLSHSLVRNDTNANWDAFVTDTQVLIGPFLDIASFVSQQYKDFVGRAPSATELTEGMAQIRNGELSPSRYIVAKAHGSAWEAKRGPVLRLYWAFFLRRPDLGGYQHWVGLYQSGKSLDDIAQFFAQSPEFVNKYGPLNDSSFVKLVYVNVLDRQAEAAGLTYWVDQLQHHGLKRGSMMVGFSEALEGQHHIAPVTDVLLISIGMMRTIPSKSFFDSWRAQVGTPPVTAPMAELILGSDPYGARFP